MAIRTNTNPREMDLQPEMQKILMRNGMQAHVVSDGSGFRLVVQGHDSPLLTYAITERQMLALTAWGSNTANKKAYNVFTSIIGNDFHLPKNFVHARNANGRVAMGLHGYRIGIGEYGRIAWPHMPPPFLGWTPRNQWLSSAQSWRRPILSGRTSCTGTMERTNETRRTAIRRLRLLLQGKQTGAIPARTGRTARSSGCNYSDDKPTKKYGTSNSIPRTDNISSIFFQREMAGMPVIARNNH